MIRSLLLALIASLACVPPSGSAPTTTPTSSPTTATTSPTASTPPSTASPTALPSAASRALEVEGRVVRPAFLVRFPARYVATTGEALTPPGTQGGIAPPAVTLTVSGQPVPTADTWAALVRGSSDCILIWHTNGFSSIADWHRHVQTSIGQLEIRALSDPRAERIGAFEFTRQTVDVASGTRSTAFVKVGEQGSFYFTTCGSGNANDLDVVLRNFEVTSR